MLVLVNAYKSSLAMRLEVPELAHGVSGRMFYTFGGQIKSFDCTIAHFIRTESEYVTFHNSNDYPDTGALVMKDESGDMYEVIYSRVR